MYVTVDKKIHKIIVKLVYQASLVPTYAYELTVFEVCATLETVLVEFWFR
jgi:hypothetical protein